MMSKSTHCNFFRMLEILSLSVILAANTFATGMDYLSPIGVAADPDGKTLYIAEATGKQISYFDLSTEKVIKTVTVSDKLTGIAVSPDGLTLCATAGDYFGKVLVVDIKNGQIRDTIDVGHSPIAPVISNNGKMLYICQKFNDNVAVIDLDAKKVVAEIPVIRSPFAAAITLLLL